MYEGSPAVGVNPLVEVATDLEEAAEVGDDLQAISELYLLYRREGREAQAARTLKRLVAFAERGLRVYGDSCNRSVRIKPPGTFSERDVAEHKVLSFRGMEDFTSLRLPIVDLYLRQPEIKGVDVDPGLLAAEARLGEVLRELASRHHKRFSIIGAEDESVDGSSGLRVELPDYVNLKYPLHVSLVLGVAACNIGCKFCNLTKRSYRKEMMSRETLDAALAGIDDEYRGRISLTPHTEPLLIDGYIDQVAYVAQSKPNADVGFNTNAVLLKPDLSRRLVESGAGHVHISLNMATKEDYLWFTGKDYFSQVVSNVETLLEIRAKSGPSSPMRVSIQLLKMPRNEHYLDTFVDEWRAKLDGVLLRDISTDVGGSVDVDGDLELSRTYRDFCKDDYTCYSMWTSLAVKWDGAVYPCCPIGNDKVRVSEDHPLRLGNVHETALFDVWNSERLRRARVAQSTSLLSPCRECRAFRQVGEIASLELERQREEKRFFVADLGR